MSKRVGGDRPGRGATSDRGSVSIEFAVLMGFLIAGFFGLLVLAGRVVGVENDVRATAHEAARAASLKDSVGLAQAEVNAIATANLRDGGGLCDGGHSASITGSDFAPGGFVTVTVECTRSLGILGQANYSYSYGATEIIDQYRGDP